MKMFALYNLSKDLIRKEAYFEVGSILEDLFQISYVHDPIEYKFDDITIYHKFFHDHVKIKFVYSISYKYLCRLHREDGPAYIEYDENGNITYEEFYLNGKRHRIDGPVITKRNNGNIIWEIFYSNGERHRIDGPAIIHYDEDEDVIQEEYWINGRLHREDGPAIIEYDGDGNITHEEFWLNGKRHG